MTLIASTKLLKLGTAVRYLIVGEGEDRPSS